MNRGTFEDGIRACIKALRDDARILQPLVAAASKTGRFDEFNRLTTRVGEFFNAADKLERTLLADANPAEPAPGEFDPYAAKATVTTGDLTAEPTAAKAEYRSGGFLLDEDDRFKFHSEKCHEGQHNWYLLRGDVQCKNCGKKAVETKTATTTKAVESAVETFDRLGLPHPTEEQQRANLEHNLRSVQAKAVEQAVCEPWCGEMWHRAPRLCSEACTKLGRPANPAERVTP